MILLERRLHNCENILTSLAVLPIIVPGVLQLGLGLIQTITAVGFRALGQYRGDSQTKARSWSHIKHGLGNIVGGAFRAIPLMGALLMIFCYMEKYPQPYSREHSCYQGTPFGCRTMNCVLDKPHWNKIMPYERIQIQDMRVFVDDRMSDVCVLREYRGKGLPSLDLDGSFKEEYWKLYDMIMNTPPFGKVEFFEPMSRTDVSGETPLWGAWRSPS